MKRIVTIAAGLLLAVSLAAAQGTWQRTVGVSNVSFEMPAKPKYTAKTLGSPGSTYTMHEYLGETGDKAYVVQIGTYPPSINVANPKANLQRGLDHSGKGMQGGKWASVRWHTLFGHQATDAVGIKDGNQIRNVSLLRGSQMIAMTYAGPIGSQNAADTERFFKSVKLQ